MDFLMGLDALGLKHIILESAVCFVIYTKKMIDINY